MTGRALDRSRLERLMAAETAAFERANPRSRELFERAKGSLLDGVPMNWMVKWAGPYPLFVDEASGARFRDVDGHEYVDFCLGDTGAMAGHGPSPTIAAVERQLRRGITHMLPTEDAIVAGDELRRRFGLRWWQFTLTATDANRFAIRLARHVTGRPKVLVHNHNYHGSVDETFAWIGPDGGRRRAARQPRRAGAAVRDHARRRVQRHRRPGARARARRRRGRAVRAGADQRRHRAARSRLPRRGPGAHPQARDAADHRRDPHDLRRARAATRRRTASSPTSSRSARRSAAGSRPAPTRSPRSWASGSPPASRGRTRTWAGSAARWPATRCRWRRSGRR